MRHAELSVATAHKYCCHGTVPAKLVATSGRMCCLFGPRFSPLKNGAGNHLPAGVVRMTWAGVTNLESGPHGHLCPCELGSYCNTPALPLLRHPCSGVRGQSHSQTAQVTWLQHLALRRWVVMVTAEVQEGTGAGGDQRTRRVHSRHQQGRGLSGEQQRSSSDVPHTGLGLTVARGHRHGTPGAHLHGGSLTGRFGGRNLGYDHVMRQNIEKNLLLIFLGCIQEVESPRGKRKLWKG